MPLNIELVYQVACKISQEKLSDIYIYNGVIARGHDLPFIELIYKHKRHSNAIVVCVTNGGDPDAGYKVARYLQNRYDWVTVIVSGLCKSAGTLIALGAHSLAFTRYGELGPLDIQTTKQDNLAERISGLTVQEALTSLTRDAILSHGSIFSAIIRDTDAIISIPTAAKAATELVTGLFSPIYSQIDPYDVGNKARAMRIAIDYGKRLEAHTNNLKAGTLAKLASTYSSHSFVIDFWEARELFNNIRLVTDDEQKMVECLGQLSRTEVSNGPTTACLSAPELTASPDGSGVENPHAGNPEGPVESTERASGARSRARRKRTSEKSDPH